MNDLLTSNSGNFLFYYGKIVKFSVLNLHLVFGYPNRCKPALCFVCEDIYDREVNAYLQTIKFMQTIKYSFDVKTFRAQTGH